MVWSVGPTVAVHCRFECLGFLWSRAGSQAMPDDHKEERGRVETSTGRRERGSNIGGLVFELPWPPTTPPSREPPVPMCKRPLSIVYAWAAERLDKVQVQNEAPHSFLLRSWCVCEIRVSLNQSMMPKARKMWVVRRRFIFELLASLLYFAYIPACVFAEYKSAAGKCLGPFCIFFLTSWLSLLNNKANDLPTSHLLCSLTPLPHSRLVLAHNDRPTVALRHGQIFHHHRRLQAPLRCASAPAAAPLLCAGPLGHGR